MSETKIPGLKSGHQIISLSCRETHGIEGAFDVAAARLRNSYNKYCSIDGAETWHLVLIREQSDD